MRAHDARSVPLLQWAPQALHRKCGSCGSAMGASCSKCAKDVDASKGLSSVQAKLRISQPGDAHEQEADQIAEAVVSGASLPGQRRTTSSPAALHRAVDPGALEDALDEFDDVDEFDELDGESLETDEFDEADGLVMRKTDTANSGSTPALVPKSGGAGLEPKVRAFMEPQFGHSFADVMVHTDDAAAASAERIDAQAYTLGSHIYFGQGRYQPAASEGQRLLAHELTHVLQQRSGAQGLFRDPKKPAGGKKADAAKKPVKKAPKGPKKIVVFLDKQKAVAMEGDKVVRSMAISSGKRGHPTDPGKFSVTEKDADHRSSKYGKCGSRDVGDSGASCKKGEKYVGAPMTNFLRFNGAEGFHKGVLPGHPDSHGCVRLGGGDAAWLFRWSKVGTTVEVLKTSPKPKRKDNKAPKKITPSKGKVK